MYKLIKAIDDKNFYITIDLSFLQLLKNSSKDYKHLLTIEFYSKLIDFKERSIDNSIYTIGIDKFYFDYQYQPSIDFELMEEIKDYVYDLISLDLKEIRDDSPYKYLIEELSTYSSANVRRSILSSLDLVLENVDNQELIYIIDRINEESINTLIRSISTVNSKIDTSIFDSRNYKSSNSPFLQLKFYNCEFEDLDSSGIIKNNSDDLSKPFSKIIIADCTFTLKTLMLEIFIKDLHLIHLKDIKILVEDDPKEDCFLSINFNKHFKKVNINITLDNIIKVKKGYKNKESEIVEPIPINLNTEQCSTVEIIKCYINDLNFIKLTNHLNLLYSEVNSKAINDLYKEPERYLSLYSIRLLEVNNSLYELDKLIGYINNIHVFSIENMEYYPYIPLGNKVENLCWFNKGLKINKLTSELIDSYIAAECQLIELTRNLEDDYRVLTPYILKGLPVEFNLEDYVLSWTSIFIEEIDMIGKEDIDNMTLLLDHLLSPLNNLSKEFNYLSDFNLRLISLTSTATIDFYFLKALYSLGTDQFIRICLIKDLVLPVDFNEDTSDNIVNIRFADIEKEYKLGLYNTNLIGGFSYIFTFLLLKCPSTNDVHIISVPNNLASCEEAIKWINKDSSTDSLYISES